MALPAITKQREIIDRRALSEALAALAEDSAAPDRNAIVKLLRDALNHGRGEIQARFESGGSAAHCVAEQCFLIDQLIRSDPNAQQAKEETVPLASFIRTGLPLAGHAPTWDTKYDLPMQGLLAITLLLAEWITRRRRQLM